MSDNPYQPPQTTPNDSQPMPQDLKGDSLTEPTLAYTAIGNLEAHGVVAWLRSHGIRAHAVEDHSLGGLFILGVVTQIHKPQVFVNKVDFEDAAELIQQYEAQRNRERSVLDTMPPITSECEECGTASEFPVSQNGTTQNCPKCNAYMDVGTDQWPEDFDFGEDVDETNLDVTDEEALDAAIELDRSGDWHEALSAYRDVAKRWPQHHVYANNCISAIQHKIDTAAGN
jgi:hypothetical protein